MELPLGDKRLYRKDENTAVAFHNHAHASPNSLQEDFCQLMLCLRVKVNLWLFHIHQLTFLRHVKCDQDWKGLRHTKTDIGNVDQVLGATCNWINESSDLKLDLSVIYVLRCNFPSE